LSPFPLQSHAVSLDLHSFPTRRSSDLRGALEHPASRLAEHDRAAAETIAGGMPAAPSRRRPCHSAPNLARVQGPPRPGTDRPRRDRKSTRLNSSHVSISYAVFCLKKKK